MVRFRVAIAVVEIVLDRFFEVVDAVENTTPDTFFGDVPEEPLDEVDPRGRGRCEVQVEPWMPGQPVLYFGMLVRRIVVHDQMQCQGFVGPPVNRLQELGELVVAVPGLALANHRSGLHVECRKQGGSAVALIIMGHRPAFPRLHRQAGLAPVQCLDLAFLVDGKHDGLLRRVQVQAHHVAQLVGKQRVVRHLEAPHLMGFQFVLPPDAMHRHPGNADLLRHRPATPLRGGNRFAGQCQGQDFLDFVSRQRRYPRRAGLAFLEPFHAAFKVAVPPLVQSRVADAQRCHNGLR